jgi:hypothetical protein
MADDTTRPLATTTKEDAARPPKDFLPWDRRLLVRRELGRDLVSLSNLLGRPVRSSPGVASGQTGRSASWAVRAPCWPWTRMLKSISNKPSPGCKRRRSRRNWRAPTFCSASG